MLFNIVASVISFNVVDSITAIDDTFIDESQDTIITISEKLKFKDKKPYFIYNDSKYNA